MEDRELLELAAKAHGSLRHIEGFGYIHDLGDGRNGAWWRPLEDDGDALRLAVRLRLDVTFFEELQEVHSAHCTVDFSATCESYGENVEAATRRAITRAAAEIGKSMP